MAVASDPPAAAASGQPALHRPRYQGLCKALFGPCLGRANLGLRHGRAHAPGAHLPQRRPPQPGTIGVRFTLEPRRGAA
jgi:hypothetical protein